MKKLNLYLSIFFLFSIVLIINSCIKASASENNSIENKYYDKRTVSKKTKDFWYDGTAEISSYQLSQARYGESHDGTAVLVYVTEPFSKKNNTKADRPNSKNIPVLKLNKTFKFNTGIYPYSMMNSTFFPFENNNYSLKMASSIQEWCGMTYLEMTNNNHFIFDFNSYFEGASFKNKIINKITLEDDLWSMIRLNPELLPIGKQQIIPSMFFLQLRHKELKTYDATITSKNITDGITDYIIQYPKLKRTLTIKYATDFPHKIIGWEDSHYSGYGNNKKIVTSKAVLIKTIKTDYWNQNRNKDKHWRQKIGLE